MIDLYAVALEGQAKAFAEAERAAAAGVVMIAVQLFMAGIKTFLRPLAAPP